MKTLEFEFWGKKRRWNCENSLIYIAIKKWFKAHRIPLYALGTILGMFCIYIFAAAMCSYGPPM